VVPADGVALSMLVAVLFGAITWNLFTWRAGLPSSSSHALIGALIGMGLVVYGVDAVQWGEVYPVFIALVTSPIAGLLLAYLLTVVLLNLFRRARPSYANSAFRRLQLFSSGFVAFSHGANDAQKTMAIITLALFSSGHLTVFDVPTWVVLAAALAIGLGTWAGGWRIIRTMGIRIVRMDPVHGFSAQTVAATVIQVATAWGLPVSTTQVVSGSVMGAGATRRFSAVRWGVARRIVWAWIFTIPASAVLAASAALLARAGPLAATLAILILGMGLFVLLARRMRRKRPSTEFGMAGGRFSKRR
jgi:PiT family inorganic phosphate transporter